MAREYPHNPGILSSINLSTYAFTASNATNDTITRISGIDPSWANSGLTINSATASRDFIVESYTFYQPYGSAGTAAKLPPSGRMAFDVINLYPDAPTGLTGSRGNAQAAHAQAE